MAITVDVSEGERLKFPDIGVKINGTAGKTPLFIAVINVQPQR